MTDAYSRKIVGYCVSETLSAMGSLKALSMALKECPDTSGLIHHSDRGVQYYCLEYVNLLKDNTIQISMTQSGDPLENRTGGPAIAERVNAGPPMRDSERRAVGRSLSYSGYGQKRDCSGYPDL